MKKISFVFFTLVLSMCLFAEGSGETKNVKDDGVVTFSVLLNEGADSPYNENWLIFEEIEKRKKIKFDVRTGPDSDFVTKKNLVFNSGDIPDLVLKNWNSEIAEFATSGILLPISDYESMLPNYKAYIKANGFGEEVNRLVLDDGKYYLLPGLKKPEQVQQWVYRKDIFDKHGLAIPQTYDEMYDSLVKLKKLYPDSTPLTARWGGAHLLAMMGSGYGIRSGWSGSQAFSFEDNAWFFSPTSDNWREMVRFLSRCMAADVLDMEAFTQDTTQYDQKVTTGKVFVDVNWVSAGMEGLNAKLQKAGVEGANWETFQVPQSTVGIRAVPWADQFNVGVVLPARVAKEPYFERLMEFVDWIYYTDEGQELATWGVEGVTFEYINGSRHLKPEIQSIENPAAELELAKDFGLYSVFALNLLPSFENYKKPAKIVDFLQECSDSGYIEKTYPNLVLTADEMEEVKMISAPLDDYVKTMQLRFIYGDASIETDWDEFLATCREKGSERIVSIWNNAYNR